MNAFFSIVFGVRSFAIALFGFTVISLGVSAARAQGELASGTVISATNLEEVLPKTFEGHPVEEMIPDRIQQQIRNSNLKLLIRKSVPHSIDPRLTAATKKYSDAVTIDPTTYQVSNYKAGTPFPKIDMNDPLAGAKIVWNLSYAQPHGDNFVAPFAIVLIDSESGIERVQHWNFNRFYMVGLTANETPILGDGSIFHKSLLFADYPQDVKGLGTFTLRYTDGRLDDIWAYIRTVRRIRRLSGGAWVDPIGGTDQLQDDIDLFNAHPTWYQSYRVLGRHWMFVVAHSGGENNQPCWNRGAENSADRFRRLDAAAQPYWNPKDVWEPREVYVVEGIPPDYHPYSKKLMWLGADNWRPYYGEMYDKKGDYWKYTFYGTREYESADGYTTPDGSVARLPFTAWNVWADIQRRHASFTCIAPFEVNIPGLKEGDFSIAVLEAAGR